MKVSVDGGGIRIGQNNTYGNAIFSENIIRALAENNKSNTYFVYTLSDTQHFLNKSNIYFQTLKPTVGWMKLRVPIEEMISPKDVFLALNQALPLHVSGKSIVFSHGLSFQHYKELYKNNYRKLSHQLDDYMQHSDSIIVSSTKVEKELKQLKNNVNIVALPFGIPYDFQSTSEKKRENYFMFVGMNHSIKQVDTLVQFFLEFIKETEFKDFKLYLCGPFLSYRHPAIKIFPEINRTALKNLYQRATGYLTFSLYESFNFPVLEALSQDCPVIALQSAIIPEMEDFVYLAEHKEKFLPIMKEVAIGIHKKINKRSLNATFNWAKYIKALTKLYI